jgi:hypothetical protein
LFRPRGDQLSRTAKPVGLVHAAAAVIASPERSAGRSNPEAYWEGWIASSLRSSQ